MTDTRHGPPGPSVEPQSSPRRTRIRGLFAEGTWYCDCNPRLPAEKFQCKNGGVNHGRWFFTCQKPQHKRCRFFLWQSDAEPREKGAVLRNGSSDQHLPRESAVGSTTASAVHDSERGRSNSTVAQKHPFEGNAQVLDLSPPLELPETPRKVPRVGDGATLIAGSSSFRTPSPDKEQPFVTPATHRNGIGKAKDGLMTPQETPIAAKRFAPAFIGEPPKFNLSPLKRRLELNKSLADELLESLKRLGIELGDEGTHVLKATCTRYEKQAQGVEKGRDVARAAVKERESRIIELTDRVAELESALSHQNVQ